MVNLYLHLKKKNGKKYKSTRFNLKKKKCKARLDNLYFKLFLIMPYDVSSLTQIDTMIVLSDMDTQDQDSSQLDSAVDPGLGFVGSDLADRAAFDAAAGLLPSISSASSSSSSVIVISDTI